MLKLNLKGFLFRMVRGLYHPTSWLVNSLFYSNRLVSDTPVKHVLLFKLDNLGDFILSLPALLSIRNQWPYAHWTAVTSVQCRGIAEMFGATVLRYDSPFFYPYSGSISHALSQVRDILTQPADLIVDFRGDPFTLLVSLRSSARWRVEIGKQRTFPTVRKLMSSRFMQSSTQHETEVYLRAIEAIGIKPANNFNSLMPANCALLVFQRLVGEWPELANRYVVLHVGASVSYKRWPISRFVELGIILYRELGVKSVLVGSQSERRLLESFRRIPDGIVNLVGVTNLEELFVLINGAALVVANDSAIGHIAAFQSRPLITLYGGPSSQESFAPRSNAPTRLLRQPCRCTSAEQEHCGAALHWCLAAITVEKVVEEARDLLL